MLSLFYRVLVAAIAVVLHEASYSVHADCVLNVDYGFDTPGCVHYDLSALANPAGFKIVDENYNETLYFEVLRQRVWKY